MAEDYGHGGLCCTWRTMVDMDIRAADAACHYLDQDLALFERGSLKLTGLDSFFS